MNKRKRASDLYRTAATSYRCCLPALTEFRGSWSYRTCPLVNVNVDVGVRFRRGGQFMPGG